MRCATPNIFLWNVDLRRSFSSSVKDDMTMRVRRGDVSINILSMLGLGLVVALFLVRGCILWVRRCIYQDEVEARLYMGDLPDELERLRIFEKRVIFSRRNFCLSRSEQVDLESVGSRLASNQETLNAYRFAAFEHVKGHVLEVGCGIGPTLDTYQELYQEGKIKSLTLTDCVHAALEVCREGAALVSEEVSRGEKGKKFPITVEPANAHALPYPDGTFDSVCLSFVLNSVEHPVLALSEANRVLKPSGHIHLVELGLTTYGVLRFLQASSNWFSERFVWETGEFQTRDIGKIVNKCRLPVLWAASRSFGKVHMMRLAKGLGPREESLPSTKVDIHFLEVPEEVRKWTPLVPRLDPDHEGLF